MELINRLKRNFFFRLFKIKHGKNLRVIGPLKLGWMSNIEIGDNVIINSGNNTPNPIGGEVITSISTIYDGHIKIGNNVGMSNCTILSQCDIEIEDDVMIGGGVIIVDTDFHPIDYEARINDDQSKTGIAPVKIKKGAFIGARTIVLKGVTVGEKAIVGAGSVVTKDVPDCEVWAGNPARFVNENKK